VLNRKQKKKIEAEEKKADEEEKKKPAKEVGELEGEPEEKMKELTKVKESEESESVNESFIVIGSVIAAVLGFKLLRDLAGKIIGKIGRGLEQTPEDLKKYVNEVCDEAASEMGGSDKSKGEAWRKYVLNKIDSGEITTLGGIEDALGVPERVYNA